MTKYIIGADECGTGCLAGPIYVCAVKAPFDWAFDGLNDSKKLTEKKRIKINEQLYSLALNKQIEFEICSMSSSEVDKYGMADALKICYGKVISKLYCDDSSVILDGTINVSVIKNVMKLNDLNFDVDLSKCRSEIKADAKFSAVMAASIIGKTARDVEMKTIQHKLYPEYGFDDHVGYPTKSHKEAIQKFGITPIHRKSYTPIKKYLNGETI